MEELAHSKIHTQFEQHLNDKGCEFGRLSREKQTNYEIHNESNVVSIKMSQDLFCNEIFPKMQESVREAKDMIKETQTLVEKANTAAECSAKSASDTKKDMWGLVLTLIGAVLLLLVVNGVTAVAKYNQDATNQNRTESILKGLATKLNIPLEAAK